MSKLIERVKAILLTRRFRSGRWKTVLVARRAGG